MRFVPPKICLSLPVRTIRDAQRHIEAYRDHVDLFEIRLDWLEDWTIEDLVVFRHEPVLWTFRPVRQKGFYRGDEQERLQVMKTLAEREWGEWIDIEWDVPAEFIRSLRPSIKILRSYHAPLPGFPSDFERFLTSLEQVPSDAIKVVLHLTQGDEILQWFEYVRTWNAKSYHGIWLIEGPYGIWTRILAPLIGSIWTYATLSRAAKQTGQGQVPLEYLTQIYRYKHIRPDRKFYGIIGDPVEHSLSPFVHNVCIQEYHLPAYYIPFQIPDIQVLKQILTWLPLYGLSVTRPFKVDVRNLIDLCDNSAYEIGSVNTLVRQQEEWAGYNTDWLGFLRPLKPYFRSIHYAWIFGAGGVARAVAYALRTQNIPFFITSRQFEHAFEVARKFNGKALHINQVPWEKVDLIVQASPLGMFGYEDRDIPIPDSALEDTVVFELVYAPPVTRFMRRAQKAGAVTIIPGLEMFIHQAIEQFFLWFGKRPSEELVRAICRVFMEKLYSIPIFSIDTFLL